MIVTVTAEWKSIYTLSGVAVGTPLLLQNQGVNNVFAIEASTSPENGVIDGIRIEVGEEWRIANGSDDIFVRVSKGTSSVFVGEL